MMCGFSFFKIDKMKVTIYKSVKDVSSGYNRDVFYCLERIRNGASKKLIEELRSLSKEEYKIRKTDLPVVCFNGTFGHRSNKDIKTRSGLIILDFDGFATTDSAIDFKSNLMTDHYIFACWISPSNLGVKALVKIPTEGEHKGYFDALCKHFDSEYWDKSGSDLARTCFESYDPDLYLNENSKTWQEIENPDISEIGTTDPTIAIKSDNRIIENLLTWWRKKYSNAKGERNSNIFKLACSFNDFGINKSECENVLMQFVEKDFTETEIKALINSAYKNTFNFRTKFFEDTKTKQAVHKMIISGKKEKDIEKLLPDMTSEEVQNCINLIKDKISLDEFWYYDENGKIKLSPHKFKFWLQQNNFFKFFPTGSNTYTFIRKDGSLIEETNKDLIKDFTLNALLERKDDGFMAYDFMASATKFFSNDFLSLLESTEVSLKRDTKDECFLYYLNGIVKVTADTVEIIDYFNIKDYIWKKQVIQRDFKEADHHKSEFRRFMYLVADKDMQRYNSLKSVFGYYLHGFKTSANNRAVIYNDEIISDNPNGGSGKGLFNRAISYIKKVAIIDGKEFDFKRSFNMQTVPVDTQVLIYDDVQKNFNFENLFSVITEGLTLEYKNQPAIKLPISQSPKIGITTNYTIGGVGGSHERRKFEVEFSSYFNENYSPLDEFGHMLFDDWTEKDFAEFDNFAINCLQYYLKNGLVKHDFKNLPERKFIKETSKEFTEWATDALWCNIRMDKKQLYIKFISDYTDFAKWLKQNTFTKWLKAWGKFNGYEVIEDSSNGLHWIQFNGDKNKSEEPF
jgi:hypothetical protein